MPCKARDILHSRPIIRTSATGDRPPEGRLQKKANSYAAFALLCSHILPSIIRPLRGHRRPSTGRSPPEEGRFVAAFGRIFILRLRTPALNSQFSNLNSFLQKKKQRSLAPLFPQSLKYGLNTLSLTSSFSPRRFFPKASSRRSLLGL